MIGAVLTVTLDNGKSRLLLTDKAAILPGSNEWGGYFWVIPDSIANSSQSGMISIISNECMIHVSDDNRVNLRPRSRVFSIKNAN